MRRTAVLCLLLPALGLVLSGARRAPSRASPAQTLAALKRAVATRDRAGEWATLSPGFKLRLNREAGRTVDVGDYGAFRREQRRDSQILQMERMMRTARVVGVRYDGQGGASVAIKFGGPLFFGTTLRVRMIHHALWELWIKGEPQPYWGFEGNNTSEVVPGPNGSYTVRTRNARGKVTWQQTFPASRVRFFHRTTRWYFHHFGAAERAFLGIGQG